MSISFRLFVAGKAFTFHLFAKNPSFRAETGFENLQFVSTGLEGVSEILYIPFRMILQNKASQIPFCLYQMPNGTIAHTVQINIPPFKQNHKNPCSIQKIQNQTGVLK